MVDGVLGPDCGGFSPAAPGSDVPDPGHGWVATPWGFAGRYAPDDLAGWCLEVVALGPARTGVLIGCCPDPAHAERLCADAREMLKATADPVRSLAAMAACATADSSCSGVCAVIDGDTICYVGRGRPGGAVALTGAPIEELDFDGGLSVAALQPGATALLCTGPVDGAATLLDGCAALHPEQIADRVIVGLKGAAVLYRHPPEPLAITVPAEPASLAVSRARLREWLTEAGVDAETCADVLLAVGEATANAAEHAVVGASGPVDITLGVRLEQGVLRLSVSDNGRWKPATVPADGPRHRGHGLQLMNALVNSFEITRAPEGTTVTMIKELPR